MPTIGELVRARARDARIGLWFEDSSWTWAEVVDAAAQRAAFLRAHAPTDAPFNVGVLLDNVPEFWFTLCGAALAGATIVGINPTRRGAELARDIAHTDCAFVLGRRFSATSFLPDVRRYGITFFNYVGKPLSYILATPEAPDDAENSLRIAFGNEAALLDIDRFARRFGCLVADGYGSTEGG